MPQRYFIRLAYDGTRYNGWQVQDNTPHTVQEILNKALSTLLSEEISTLGCGRTDTGVHAKEFYANFDSAKTDLASDPRKWVHKFNAVLPQDISVNAIWAAEAEANARFDAVARTYEYIICRKRDPFMNGRAFYLYSELDLKKMNEAAALLMGYTDFSSFSKLHTQVKTNDCKVSQAVWEERGDLLVFTIRADRFLRNMVRAIVGTLVEAGQGKISIEDFKKIVSQKDRSEAGFSVPACGLYLTKVEYKPGYFKG